MKKKISVILLAICMAITAMTTAVVAASYCVGESVFFEGTAEGGSGTPVAIGLPDGLYVGYSMGGSGNYYVAGTVLPGTVGSYRVTVTADRGFDEFSLEIGKGSQTICLKDSIKSLSLHEDETYSLGAYSIDVSENVIDVSSVDPSLVAEHQPTYTYSSSDTSVATVSADGVVTGVGSGSTTITISSAETGSYLAATPISITVTSTAHTPTDTGTVVSPTCTEQGYTRYYCSTCDSYYYRNYTPATGHTADEPTVENEVSATCTEEGSFDSVVYCTECGEELSRETITVPATGHTAGEPTVENEVSATCTTDGSYDSVVYCTDCNEELSRETITVPATGHTEVTDLAVEPTCTETGLTEGRHCSVCNEVIVEQEEVAALGHAYEISHFTWADNYRSATATFACANCSDEQIVDATVTVENYYGMYVYVATARYGTSGATYSSVKTVGTVDMSSLETNSTEEVETEEPVEGTDTETEADEEPEAKTNPTTGIAMAMMPMAVAAAATVVAKRKL